MRIFIFGNVLFKPEKIGVLLFERFEQPAGGEIEARKVRFRRRVRISGQRASNFLIETYGYGTKIRASLDRRFIDRTARSSHAVPNFSTRVSKYRFSEQIGISLSIVEINKSNA